MEFEAYATRREHPSDVEEVVCDVFAQVWRRCQSYDVNKGSVMAWLMIISRSRALDLLRKIERRNSREITRDISENLVPETGELFGTFQASSQINALLSELSDAQREMIGLAFFKGLSHQEISDRLNVPIGTVKSHVRRGLQFLRKKMGSRSDYYG